MARPYSASRRRAHWQGVQHRVREEERRQVRELAPARPRRLGDDVGSGPLCPVDPTHGHLLSWTSGGYDYLCPHEGHTGLAAFFMRGPNGEAVAR